MRNNLKSIRENSYRRSYGIHLTSKDIFLKYIFPEIQDKLWSFKWIDLYAGEGNLILPILNAILPEKRVQFYEDHIYLSDIQSEMIEKCIRNAENYGIPYKVAAKNIKLRNNLESFPVFLKKMKYPLFHITNPPYLYLGYIRKHKETQKYLPLFKDKNEGYQDLYQIAMINDLRNSIQNLIYIIPSNFIFGASVSNKFRRDFLKFYRIDKMIIFEIKIFEYTGTNICIGFFKKKVIPLYENIKFEGIKIKKQNKLIKKHYSLKPEFNFRAGSEFDEFLKEYRVKHPLKINYYLLKKEVLQHKGNNEIKVIDANIYKNNKYKTIILRIDDILKQKIESNILYVRTVDTGSYNGRVGLSIIKNDYSVKGIYVSGNTYRTHPIQIFLNPIISPQDQQLIKSYFNFMIETFRKKLDSEFLTTYKYSEAAYTRKYLGLTQTRKLIETLPFIEMNLEDKEKIKKFMQENKFEKILTLLQEYKN
ncbi:MAG: SAM-dependent DNA methyltransferase [Promethearchaeota archaeon]